MSAASAAEGILLLLAQAVAVGLPSARLAGRVAPPTAPLLRLLVAWMLGLAILCGTGQLLAAAGLLWPASMLAVEGAVAALVLRRVAPGPAVATTKAGMLGTAVGALGAVFACAAAAVGLAAPSHEFETMRYHVANAAHWLDGGSLWTLPLSLPGIHSGAFPGNGEMVGAALMWPLHADAVVYVAPVLFAVLAVLAAAQVAAELGGRLAGGALAALALLATPLVFYTQVDSLMVDLAAAGGLVAALAFALHARQQPGELRWPLLAGLAAGFAAGTKYTIILPAVAVIVVVALSLPRGRRRSGVLAFVGGALPLFVAWPLRDLIATGNPLYPLGLTVGGHALLSGGSGPVYTGDVSLFSHLARGHFGALHTWGQLNARLLGFALAPVAVGLTALVPALRRRNLPLALAAGFALFCTAVYFITPLTGGGPTALPQVIGSNLRYLVPGLLVAVAIVPGWMPRAGTALAGAVLAWDVGWLLHTTGQRSGLALGAAAGAGAVLVGALITAVGVAWWTGGARAWLQRATGTDRVVAVALASAVAALCVALPAEAGVRQTTADPIGVLACHATTIALVDDADVRDALGPQLQRRPLGVGTGAQGDLSPITDAAQFDAALARLDTDTLVVGHLGVTEAPVGWTPPPDWHPAGKVPGGELYIRHSCAVGTASR